MRLLIASLFLLSSTAMACPNLAGVYKTCRSSTGDTSGASEMEITQQIVGGVTIYSITSVDDETQERVTETYRADGKVHTQSETSPEMGEITFTSKVTCQGEKLLYDIAIKAQGIELVSMNGNMSKSDKVLTHVSKGQVFGLPVEDKVICE